MAEAAAAAAKKPLPVVPFLKIPEQGQPYLEGHPLHERARPCSSARATCARRAARASSSKAIKLANKGELYVYSITYRSFPGIETPYVSAVVDLDGGGTVKGNLIGIDPIPRRSRWG